MGFNYDMSSDEDSDEDRHPPIKDDRSLTNDTIIPRFWGAVRINDAAGQPGLERDNALRDMLSRNAYLSRTTNTVYVGDSAREALEKERQGAEPYSPFGPKGDQNNQVYVRAPHGLPLTPDQVKRLRTIYRDGKNRFLARHRAEAYLLLWELFTVANRVLPEHRDRAMSFLLEPNGFDVEPPRTVVIRGIRSLPRQHPPKQGPPPTGGDLSELDVVGLYMLNYHRPGSTNPSAGIAIDYAFHVGRRSLFGYALVRLLSPLERELAHAFRRQLVQLMALPRRYREAIVDHNRAHPQSPFVPQGPHTYSVHRARFDSNRAANLSQEDVIQALLDNRIPPEWIDHCYAYGVAAFNAIYSGAPIQ
jgi:hypothetical protein